MSVAVLALSACKTPGVAAQELPRFEKVAEGEEFPVALPARFSTTRGWLVVAEDRSDRGSTEIRLPVAIIHAETDSGGAPVVYLSGGPGTSALSAAQYPGAYPWTRERDFIVVGQRGTEYAQPSLMCSEYREAVANRGDTVAAALACKRRLTGAGVDLQHYNSQTSAADLEDLRRVLGIDRWTLYGVSYGTRLALTYAKHYGGAVASMVLDSPLPPNAIYDDESASNLESALRAIAKDCAAQASCDSAFPDLESRFFKRVETVSAKPIAVPALNRTFDGADLVALIPLSAESHIALVPLYMDAIARDDSRIYPYLSGAPAAGDFAWGMRFSVWCSEAAPFSERYRSDKPASTLGGYESAAIDPALCRAWDVPSVDSEWLRPVAATTPTLILAGEFDPLTPPRWGTLAAESLENSLVVTVRGAAHTPTQEWGGDGCAMALADAFVRDPEQVLDSQSAGHCIIQRSGPDYLTSLE